jgi:hypothetical protein
MGTIITRIGFCEVCFKEKRAKTNQKLLLLGSTSDALKAVLAVRNGRAGFVPHLYRLRKVIDNKVFYQKVCCICGHYEEEDDDGKNYLYLDEEKWSGWIKTSLTNWNALVLFKDTGFEI